MRALSLLALPALALMISACGSKEQTITVLGAWDSDPEKKEVSYLSEVGKALVGRTPGETVEVRDPETEVLETLTIQSIRPYNP